MNSVTRNWAAIAGMSNNFELQKALVNTKGEMLKRLAVLEEFFLVPPTPQPKILVERLALLIKLATGIDVVVGILNDLGFNRFEMVSFDGAMSINVDFLRKMHEGVLGAVIEDAAGVRWMLVSKEETKLTVVAESEARTIFADFTDRVTQRPIRDHDSHAPVDERSYEPTSFITGRGDVGKVSR